MKYSTASCNIWEASCSLEVVIKEPTAGRMMTSTITATWMKVINMFLLCFFMLAQI